jgi:hypothetical protein
MTNPQDKIPIPQGIWGMEVRPSATAPSLQLAFKELATLAEIEENEFIFRLLESLEGRQPTEQIWQPVFPSATMCE